LDDTVRPEEDIMSFSPTTWAIIAVAVLAAAGGALLWWRSGVS
jgi:hypothetical protein